MRTDTTYVMRKTRRFGVHTVRIVDTGDKYGQAIRVYNLDGPLLEVYYGGVRSGYLVGQRSTAAFLAGRPSSVGRPLVDRQTDSRIASWVAKYLAQRA